MRRVDRCIYKELAAPLIGGTFVIALLFVANELIRIFKLLNVAEMPAISIIQLILYRIPFWMIMTLPVGVAIGASLAMGRLTRESEVTAMKAAGIPIRRILLPVGIAGLIFSGLDFLVIEKILPPTAKKYEQLQADVSNLAVQPTFRADVMIKVDRYTAHFGSVQRRRDGGLDLSDIFLIERPKPHERTIYMASSGMYQDGVWTINNPTMLMFAGLDLHAFTTEQTMEINERIRVADVIAPPPADTETIGELKAAIDQARSQGLNPTSLLVDYHGKFSVPASCLVFALTSALSALWLSKGGPFSGLMLSLGLVLLYFNTHVIATEIFGRGAIVGPALAAWLPNILFAVIGLVAYWRVR
jgi:lipopolysaccharide export system permease protein